MVSIMEDPNVISTPKRYAASEDKRMAVAQVAYLKYSSTLMMRAF
jgi:hypothetical protein